MKQTDVEMIVGKIDSLSEKTDRLSEKTDSLDKDNKVLKSTVDRVVGKIDTLSGRFDTLSEKVGDQAEKTEGLRTDNASMRLDIKDLYSKFGSLEGTLSEFRNDVFKYFDKIYNKFDFFKDEYYGITAGLRRIEDDHKIIDHRTIFNEIQSLKNRN